MQITVQAGTKKTASMPMRFKIVVENNSVTMYVQDVLHDVKRDELFYVNKLKDWEKI